MGGEIFAKVCPSVLHVFVFVFVFVCVCMCVYMHVHVHASVSWKQVENYGRYNWGSKFDHLLAEYLGQATCN